jgi:hypothetical protein
MCAAAKHRLDVLVQLPTSDVLLRAGRHPCGPRHARPCGFRTAAGSEPNFKLLGGALSSRARAVPKRDPLAAPSEGWDVQTTAGDVPRQFLTASGLANGTAPTAVSGSRGIPVGSPAKFAVPGFTSQPAATSSPPPVAGDFEEVRRRARRRPKWLPRQSALWCQIPRFRWGSSGAPMLA